LVGIAAPVREKELVAGVQLANLLEQPSEVGGSMHQRFGPVAGAPGQTIWPPPVKRAGIIAALCGR
jgi:hypothetical protein